MVAPLFLPKRFAYLCKDGPYFFILVSSIDTASNSTVNRAPRLLFHSILYLFGGNNVLSPLWTWGSSLNKYLRGNSWDHFSIQISEWLDNYWNKNCLWLHSSCQSLQSEATNVPEPRPTDRSQKSNSFHKGMYHCMTDLLFDRFEFDEFICYSFNITKAAESKQIKQLTFLLESKWIFDEYIFLLFYLLFTSPPHCLFCLCHPLLLTFHSFSFLFRQMSLFVLFLLRLLLRHLPRKQKINICLFSLILFSVATLFISLIVYFSFNAFFGTNMQIYIEYYSSLRLDLCTNLLWMATKIWHWQRPQTLHTTMISCKGSNGIQGFITLVVWKAHFKFNKNVKTWPDLPFEVFKPYVNFRNLECENSNFWIESHLLELKISELSCTHQWVRKRSTMADLSAF